MTPWLGLSRQTDTESHALLPSFFIVNMNEAAGGRMAGGREGILTEEGISAAVVLDMTPTTLASTAT